MCAHVALILAAAAVATTFAQLGAMLVKIGVLIVAFLAAPCC